MQISQQKLDKRMKERQKEAKDMFERMTSVNKKVERPVAFFLRGLFVVGLATLVYIFFYTMFFIDDVWPEVEKMQSEAPSSMPTLSSMPSLSPSISSYPSSMPSSSPSGVPSAAPSSQPSGVPSSQPSSGPSFMPSVSTSPTIQTTTFATSTVGGGGTSSPTSNMSNMIRPTYSPTGFPTVSL